MSIVYENYLIIILCFLVLFFAIKCVISKKIIAKDREYFIKTLSHDIRVSVIAQMRGLELLQKNMHATQTELIKDLDYNCKYTLDMVSILINNYKYKNNDLALNYEFINLSNIILKVTESLSKTAQEKKITFDYYNKSSAIMADKVWITKAIQILISTIIALSDIQEKIICSANDVNGGIKLDFKYTGRSLSEEEYKKMFSGDTKYSTVGFGIKMHMLKNIVDLHLGKILVTKTISRKNIFTIILPANKSAKKHKTKLINKLQPFRL